MKSSPSNRGNATGTLALVVALIALVAAIGAIVYQFQIAGPRDAWINEQNQVISRLTGVDKPAATNPLASRFVDADGDLVADAPADPAKQIDPPVLKFSYIAVEGDTIFKSAFEPVMQAIAKSTGKQVEYVEFISVEDQLRALRDGTLHVAGLSTGAVPMGVCVAGFAPVCMMADEAGNATYQWQIIANKSSGISSINDLRGRELTFTDPSSNSGHKAPLATLRDMGMRPPQDYQTRYSFSHARSIQGVKDGTYLAAVVAGDVLKRELAAGKVSESDFRIIYTSKESFPSAAIGLAHQLKPDLADKIRVAILGFDWKSTALEAAFKPEGRHQFVPADYRKDWAYVRQIDDSLGLTYQLNDPMPTTSPATAPTE